VKKLFTVLFIIMLLNVQSFAQLTKAGFDNWSFRKLGDSSYMPAEVPGTVHTDLLANGVIEDPFYRDNEMKVQWIEKEDWVYRTEFTADDIIDETRIDLVFKGLDTYAQVFINGKNVLNTDNMFVEYRISNFHQYFVKGNNILEVVFRSPLSIEDSLSKAFFANTGIENLPVKERPFTRKAAYHYGWDWSPRFVTCGIWRDVYMEVYKKARINNVLIKQTISDDFKSVVLDFETDIYSETDNIYEVEIINKNDGSVNRFLSGDKKSITIENPKLWWSNGLGEQYMYSFEIKLKYADEILDTKTIRTGIRKIELIQEDDSYGKSFYFKVNGVPVFMKGANFIPADNFLPRVTKEKYRQLIKLAKESNMNMLRVWGGGVYEDDEFYNQCDENGILVWQDFMFACAMYPWDNTFLAKVDAEAEYNIKRLGNHPSLALWCGNNENDEGWQNWGWQNIYNDEQKNLIWNGYKKVFHELLPSLVKNYSDGISYVTTSPQYGWGRKESMTHGDSHYWGVWWGMAKFDTLEKKVPRFMSEYGFQSFPDTSTVNKFTEEKDRYLFSDVLKTHQKHPTGYENLTKYMKMYDISTEDYHQYIRNTQELQELCLITAIEAHRKAKPYCMGTLFWQFNDCNPVVSWSVVDYYGTPKLSLNTVKELYAETILISKEGNGKLNLYIVSDKQAEQKASLLVLNYDEDILDSVEVTIPANSSAKYYEYDTANSYYRDVDFLLVFKDGREVSSNRYKK